MKAPIKPLADRVVAVRQEPATQTASGLYLPDANERPVDAEIIAVGPDVKHLKLGDRIIMKEYTGTELEYGGQKYTVIKEEDVLATVIK